MFDIFTNNTEVFDESEEIIVFTNQLANSDFNLPDKIKVEKDHLQIKPEENSFEALKNVIPWTEIETLLIYRKPIGNNEQEILRKGKEAFLYEMGEQTLEKKNVDPEWEFIYQLQPDVFLSKKNNSVMIGSLTNRTLINIKWNMPKNSTKADLITHQTNG